MMVVSAVLECPGDGNKIRAGDTCSEAGYGISLHVLQQWDTWIILNALVTYGSKIILCYLEQVLWAKAVVNSN